MKKLIGILLVVGLTSLSSVGFASNVEITKSAKEVPIELSLDDTFNDTNMVYEFHFENEGFEFTNIKLAIETPKLVYDYGINHLESTKDWIFSNIEDRTYMYRNKYGGIFNDKKYIYRNMELKSDIHTLRIAKKWIRS